jgi:RimJ/RimL family protein N-acetyltransferase
MSSHALLDSTLRAPARLCLRGEGLCLRPFEDADAAAFAEATRESVASVGRWMPWCIADYTEEDARSWFAECADDWTGGHGLEFGIFADDGHTLLGGAGLNQFNTQHQFCNLGYWVRESRQRQGIATRTVRLLADFGFRTLGLTRIEIVVAEGNDASCAVARKAGATPECLARHRLVIAGTPVAAWVHSLIPADE